MLITLGLAVFALIFLLQGDGTGPALPGVVPIVEATGAATVTGYLVGFFKKARPDSGDAPIVAVAVLAGLFSAVVISMVNGGIQISQLGIGTILLQGIGAAALSAAVQVSNKPSVSTSKGM